MITVTRQDGTSLTGLIFTYEGTWSRDGKLIVHEISGADGDIYYPNGSTSYTCVIQGRMENTSANHAILDGCLHKLVDIESDAKGEHKGALVTSVTVTKDTSAWIYFNMVVVL